jgi:thiamine biosynthesis protein ThiC
VESDDKQNTVYEELQQIKDKNLQVSCKVSLGDSMRSGEVAPFF